MANCLLRFPDDSDSLTTAVSRASWGAALPRGTRWRATFGEKLGQWTPPYIGLCWQTGLDDRTPAHPVASADFPGVPSIRMLTLHQHPLSTFSRRIRMALLEKGLDANFVDVDIGNGAVTPTLRAQGGADRGGAVKVLKQRQVATETF